MLLLVFYCGSVGVTQINLISREEQAYSFSGNVLFIQSPVESQVILGWKMIG
jgi:hypothetical protein